MIKLTDYTGKRHPTQYLISISVTLVVALICFFISDVIGYRAVALVLLFNVSLLAIVFSLYPVLISAVLIAMLWDFFFIPPHYTFHINTTEDVLMLTMFLTIALLNGILTSRIRHFEKQVQQREQRLQALKLYNALFNSISHELRTPLTTIIGAAETLIGRHKKIQDTDRMFLQNEILLASTRLNRLVDNLLNMSRLESGMLRPKLDWCDVNELIHTVVNRLRPEIEKFPVSILIPENVPMVKMDFGLMEQALFNILHNITVHTPPGTSVNINVSIEENDLVLSISDDGPGFEKQSLGMVFDKFSSRGDSGKSGLGLGLSISRGFIQAHSGTITVANHDPHGALFTIRIPVETIRIEPENE
jgi:two-component system sensor histidine kinase KdpD